MQRISYLLMTCIGILAAAPGCGSNQGCIDYAKTICTRQIECSQWLAKIDGSNFDTCVTLISRSCELSTNSPDSNFHQDTASACGQALTTASCDAILAGPRPDSCRPPGNRAIGASCAEGFQCQSLFCNRPTAHDCGVCAVLPKSGEPCGASGVCDLGLQCGQGICVPLRNSGETCDDNYACNPTLACMSGTCQQPMLGGACNAASDCSEHALQACDANTLSCAAVNYTVDKTGESCGFDSTTGAILDCAPDAYCKTMGGSQSFGVCTALPKEGEACASVDAGGGAVYQLCLSPTTCITGTCQVFDRGSCG